MLHRMREVQRSHPRQKKWRPDDMPKRNDVYVPWEMRSAMARLAVDAENSPEGQQINVQEIDRTDDVPGPFEALLVAASGAYFQPKKRGIVARTAIESLRCRDLIFQNMDEFGQCFSVIPDLDVQGGRQLDSEKFQCKFGGDMTVFLKHMFEKHHGEAIEVGATWESGSKRSKYISTIKQSVPLIGETGFKERSRQPITMKKISSLSVSNTIVLRL